MQKQEKMFIISLLSLALMFAGGLFTQYKLSVIPQEPRIVEVKVPYVVEKIVTVEKDVTKDRVKIQKGDTTITNDLKEV